MANKTTKKMVITVAALVLVFGGVFGWKAVQGYFMGQYFASFEPPPETVSAVIAAAENWQPTLTAVGSLIAVQGVELANEVPGVVERIDFDSGEDVRAGEPLVKLDDSAERAELQGLLAARELARKNAARSEKLLAEGFVSPAAIDSVRSQLQQAEANVANKRTMIAKKTIRAPFDGRLGIRQINLGQYLAAGTKLVSLQSLHPLYVNFSLPEQERARIEVGQSIKVGVDSFPGEAFEARISAIESRVDPQTRNVAVQATLPNPKRRLQPGMFADVDVLLPVQNAVITLPKTAITYSPYGNAVFLIKKDGQDKEGKPVLRVQQQVVQTGASQGERVTILKGVSAGDQVVTAGQLKLQNGTRVVINNSVAQQ